MTNEEIVTKVSIDEVEVSKPMVETINVEEVATQIATLEQDKANSIAMYDALILENTTNRDNKVAECDSKIAELSLLLTKASEVWVTPDGVVGEVVEPVVEETPVISETENTETPIE